ncbi:MAG TPA: heme-binding protein [Steroidobacteraceae bacterium]
MRRQHVLAALAAACLVSCGGGADPAVVSTGTSGGCSGNCATASSLLTVTDVEQVIAQGVAEAQARKVNATVGVVDRVGNVLAVYRMGAAASRPVLIASQVDASGHNIIHTGLEGIRLPSPGSLGGFNLDELAVIAKAITGAYLSSEGNALSTRTASQIVQQHFDPGTHGAPAGPLFGVQFSQLACSDLVMASPGTGATVGPQRSPLGLSADPGGFPLYKDGTVVGGVGVLADGIYGADTAFDPHSVDLDEAIAMAATFGYGAPADRRADQITVGGLALHYTNTEYAALASDPGSAPAYSSLTTAVGSLVAVTGYADGLIHAGTAFGQPASGVRPEGGADFPGQDAFILVDATNTPRFPARAGTDGPDALTRDEVLQVLRSALAIAAKARGQIRLPLGDTARVSITIVDTLGSPLGFVRSRDAPLFGADVALQKARTAALFSSSSAAAFLASLPPAQYVSIESSGLTSNGQVRLGGYITAARSFIGDSGAFSDGTIAYSDRAVSNLSRPLFPDGIDGAANGPFSKPLSQWSVFSTGLQLDLALNAILQHVIYAIGVPGATDVPVGCAGVGLSVPPLSPSVSITASAAGSRLRNGLQIFAGSVPIYRGSLLVGAIGVSGDGVDQDDMVAFLGLHEASQALNGSISQAPADRRADTLRPQGTRLLYVQCPQAPFLDSDQENVCEGL